MPIHKLLDEADMVVHYNGQKFDIPVLNKEFIKHGFPPPAPFKQVDLMRVCRRIFRFESNKLGYVTEALSIGSKMQHEGFGLWVKCMEGNQKAWTTMEAYNREDVALLGRLYNRLKPWISNHPSFSALRDEACCPKCGSGRYQRRGEVLTTTLRYARYQCQSCGGWFRGTKTVSLKRQDRMANVAGA